MKTETEIYLEYENALRQADDLERSAKEMDRTVHEKLTEIQGRLKESWQGEGAGTFAAKSAVLGKKAAGAAILLREASQAVRSIAQNIYNAEMKSLEIARAREYS